MRINRLKLSIIIEYLVSVNITKEKNKINIVKSPKSLYGYFFINLKIFGITIKIYKVVLMNNKDKESCLE